MSDVQIRTALISVFDKNGLEPIVKGLAGAGVQILSTGGTYDYIKNMDIAVDKVEELTTYPSILDGRVKTLHPKVFGGILARRENDHQEQLAQYSIPEIDLVVVDLYPFEDTVANTQDEATIIEKIDIGGISLIRAAAKNYRDVVVVASKNDYDFLAQKLASGEVTFSLAERKQLATNAFAVSSHYDTAIYDYFLSDDAIKSNQFGISLSDKQQLRYGENPHQKGYYYGNFVGMFNKMGGKELSYNNLVDVDAAFSLMSEFVNDDPTFAILKHTNSCGLATRPTVLEAWQAALEADSVSAFGGILISNTKIDLKTAKEINAIFYEVLIAPDFSDDALDLLLSKKKRIILRVKTWEREKVSYKSVLNGVLVQESDLNTEDKASLEVMTNRAPTEKQVEDLLFAAKCAKHLKSNTIVLAKDQQLLGMGCGQTSRVDALKQAIVKAKNFNFDLNGAVMASDAFFPFSDCVEIAHKAGIKAVIQPGGSIRDTDSIDYCNDNGLSMVKTGVRHFKH